MARQRTATRHYLACVQRVATLNDVVLFLEWLPKGRGQFRLRTEYIEALSWLCPSKHPGWLGTLHTEQAGARPQVA